jgi:hypothetical protein
MIEVLDKDILTHIHNWISYVSSTKTSNNFFICPYASNVLKNRRLQVYYFDINNIDHIVKSFNLEEDAFKVWVFIYYGSDIKADCLYLNNNYSSITWLYDEATNSGEIDGVKTGNQKYNIILMQDKLELNKLSSILEKNGYYTNWSKEYYNQIVESRLNES